MLISTFKNKLQSLQKALDTVIKENINLDSQTDSIHDFKARKKAYYAKSVENSLKELKKAAADVVRQYNTPNTMMMLTTVNSMQVSDPKKMLKKVDEIAQLVFELKENKPEGISINIPTKIPAEIKGDIIADLEELKKCYDSGCYRSVAILCGRILETVLHRKYFDVTQRDILDTNPGIGLGNLIAKLAEKQVVFDPGLTQQIHLINQVRVFSVHKKQTPFYPSKDQSQAMILYMMDIINKVWK